MAFAYRLEDEPGNPGDPPTFQTAVPNWRVSGSRMLSATPTTTR